ncbi:MAG TPA: 1,4-alpha-glucan branching protein GlgB [Candidatus Binataceae bacterium]|nr:1,4-alpha-glucan branching protein GlgB [Candidatus Binataceae bacterium]
MEPDSAAAGRHDLPDGLQRLIALEHRDPHAILGAHLEPQGVVVRVFRPDASRVTLLIDGEEEPRAMTRIEPAGLFSLRLRRRRELFGYRLQIQFGDGSSIMMRDPYSFLPTVGDLDLHLMGELRHDRPYEVLGAHVREPGGVSGVAFAVWAPNARSVSVVGDFNSWDGRIHMMRSMGGSGIWELFIPGLADGERYKYEIRPHEGPPYLKTDPWASSLEQPPATASIVYRSRHRFEDDRWMGERGSRDPLRAPLSIYEVHLGSWRRVPEERNRWLTYRELGPALADYVSDLGFTHVELLPIMEHPFSGSWGYQVSGYFAPTARFGTPDDFRSFVDALHRRNIGVILDWVPGHFPTDAFALARFDGTALYEHLDPRRGFQPEWGTYIFNFGRTEVRNFLLGSAQCWLREFHVDGLRVDAVASMLYLDYARRAGDWLPNIYGGRENLEAVDFLRILNERIYDRLPGAMTLAEESTSWPAVSRPTYTGGLGFSFKWDMGWMHDTLDYFSKDPVYRRWHHRDLTFGLLYAWNENFVLPLSHDEVVYGKRSLLSKMPGDRWRQFANLRALYGYMWARPGKKLLFMGGEFGQWNEWNAEESLDWHLLAGEEHRGLQSMMRELNRLYREHPALWEADHDHRGFEWIAADNSDDNVIAFMRIAPASGGRVICACNFAPVPREHYRIGAPRPGYYREILNTDAAIWSGGNVGNAGGVNAEPTPYNGMPHSISITLPPLGVLWFEVPRD